MFERPDNDFAWLGIPPQFPLDTALLDRAYRERQSEYHPDRFVLADAEIQQKATFYAAEINEAYRRLRDPITAAESLYHIRFGDQALEKAKGDCEFLAQTLQWREEAEAAAEDDDIGSLNTLADCLRNAIAEVHEETSAGFQAEDKAQVVQAITEWKYLKKTLEDIEYKIDALA